MAITLPTNFNKLALVNAQDRVGLVHLFYDDTNYLAFSQQHMVISTVVYKACVHDFGSSSVSWQIEQSNNVTIANPTIILNKYSAPDDYNIESLFYTYQFVGKKIKVYYGYARMTSLSDFINPFNGKVESVEFKDNQIHIVARAKQFPDVEIGGRELHYFANTIGDTNYSGRTVPQESDEKIIPVAFGNHWNAPLVAYSTDSATGDFRVSGFDNDWWSDLSSANSGLTKSHFRNNVNAAMQRLLIEQDGYLVPFFAENYDNVNNYSDTPDATVGSLQAIEITTHNNDLSLFAECPMRLRFDDVNTGSLHAGTGVTVTASSDIDDVDCPNLFDADGNTYVQWTATYPSGSGAKQCYRDLWAYLDLDRNLRSNATCVVFKGRPIHIPTGENGTGAIWLGRFKVPTKPASGYTFSIFVNIYAEVLNPALTAGHSQLIRREQAPDSSNYSDYDYYSYLYLANPASHNLDFSTDEAQNYIINAGSPYYKGYAEAGNSSASADENRLPFLLREAFDKQIYLELRLYQELTAGAASQSIQSRFYDLVLSMFDAVNYSLDQFIYTDLQGATMADATDIYSRASGATSVYQLRRPAQYIEAMARAKAAAVDADFSAAEWQASYAKFTSMFPSQRDYSGFCIHEKTPLSRFMSSYVDKEPFTAFIDGQGLWRFLMLWKNKSALTGGETAYEWDFKDFDTFEMGMTPQENLCSEIKSMETDYIYFKNDYAEKWHWKLDSAEYDFAYWVSDNTEANNRHFIDKIQKRYTSSVNAPDRVASGGRYYGCTRTNKNQTPSLTSNYWHLLAGDNSTAWGGTPSAWSSSTTYYGTDAENRACAEIYLNQWANRHNTVKFSTSKNKYKKHEVGDIGYFANVPYTLNGMTILGFNGDESTEEVAVNGQDALYLFIVTKVTHTFQKTTIECMQYHDLTTYSVLCQGEQAIA